MNWEQVLKNLGTTFGFAALIICWLGQALWMRVEADKRGMSGWLWAFIGIITPPIGLFFFLFWRMRYPVREEVAERDQVIEETSRTRQPFYKIMDERRAEEAEAQTDEPTPPEANPEERAASLSAALEAEERRYRER